MSVHSRSKWNLEVLVFKERGKLECPEKSLSEQGRDVEASNVINDPKCNKGPKCNNFWP